MDTHQLQHMTKKTTIVVCYSLKSIEYDITSDNSVRVVNELTTEPCNLTWVEILSRYEKNTFTNDASCVWIAAALAHIRSQVPVPERFDIQLLSSTQRKKIQDCAMSTGEMQALFGTNIDNQMTVADENATKLLKIAELAGIRFDADLITSLTAKVNLQGSPYTLESNLHDCRRKIQKIVDHHFHPSTKLHRTCMRTLPVLLSPVGKNNARALQQFCKAIKEVTLYHDPNSIGVGDPRFDSMCSYLDSRRAWDSIKDPCMVEFVLRVVDQYRPGATVTDTSDLHLDVRFSHTAVLQYERNKKEDLERQEAAQHKSHLQHVRRAVVKANRTFGNLVTTSDIVHVRNVVSCNISISQDEFKGLVESTKDLYYMKGYVVREHEGHVEKLYPPDYARLQTTTSPPKFTDPASKPAFSAFRRLMEASYKTGLPYITKHQLDGVELVHNIDYVHAIQYSRENRSNVFYLTAQVALTQMGHMKMRTLLQTVKHELVNAAAKSFRDFRLAAPKISHLRELGPCSRAYIDVCFGSIFENKVHPDQCEYIEGIIHSGRKSFFDISVVSARHAPLCLNFFKVPAAITSRKHFFSVTPVRKINRSEVPMNLPARDAKGTLFLQDILAKEAAAAASASVSPPPPPPLSPEEASVPAVLLHAKRTRDQAAQTHIAPKRHKVGYVEPPTEHIFIHE